MNYKFNLGHVSVNIPSEATIEVKDITVEVTDFNLKDIPGIIKETRKAFKDIKDMVEAENTPQPEQHSVPEFPGFPSFDEFMEKMMSEECMCGQCGEDTDGNALIKETIANAIKQQLHPDAILIETPNGFAVAIPAVAKGANE